MRFLTLALLSFFLLLIGNTYATGFERNSHILDNLKDIEIFVEGIFQGDDSNSLNVNEIKRYIRRKLSENDIRVLDPKKTDIILGLPTLYVDVSKKEYSVDIYVYYINISLREVVKLERDHLFTNAATWSDGELGVIHKKSLGDLQQVIYRHIDTFIDSYRSANPHLIKTHSAPASPSVSEYQKMISQAQEQLKALGYEPGPIDGRLGMRTKQSLKRYQLAMGLLVTGDIDEDTRIALGFTFQVQEQLKNAGFDPGPIDGRLGLQTKRALRHFQNAHGLPITGELDEETRRSLNLDL